MRPIYVAAHGAERRDHGHAGLWFDKFCDQWSPGWTMAVSKDDKDKKNPKRAWLDMLTGCAIGEPGQLREAKLRLARMTRATGGRFVVFRSESRFVTGLGRAHPVENGFAFHPTLGTPYLPGSSVKGLLRAWARSGDTRLNSAEIDRLFGKGGTDGSAGALCVLDAIPIAPVRLEVDILNPHAAGWSPDDPPGDWRSPIPVPFLVTAAGAKFLFAVLPAPGRSASESDLERALGLLCGALAWEGAGAKTAVGYGRFERMDTTTAALDETLAREEEERIRKRLMAQPGVAIRLEVEEADESGLQELIQRYLGPGSTKEFEDGDREAFVAAIRELRGDWLEFWRDGKLADGSKVKKRRRDKLKKRAQLVDTEPNTGRSTCRDT